MRIRSHNVHPGVLPTGLLNAIVDVHGVKVGHTTLHRGTDIRTGVTAILPPGNLFQRKLPASIFVGNGFGKLIGFTQVHELGLLETPILLTNTLSAPTAANALIEYTLNQPGNESVKSINPLVGETNDGVLNDIRARHVRIEDCLQAIDTATTTNDQEGCIGAGTGTICFGYKGGIGTASRKVANYTLGALVQTNFGGVLTIAGIPIGGTLAESPFPDHNPDGSCMIVIATDAPLDARQLHRLAKRSFMGLARTGGIASHGSGDYAIAFSTAESLRVDHEPKSILRNIQLLHDNAISPLFLAAIEATEEAILNSLFTATTTTGFNNSKADAIPIETILPLLHQSDVVASATTS